VISEAENAQVTLIGTGTELSLALQAQELLKAKGVAARVVSAPSLEIFLQQDAAYRDLVVDPNLPAVAVEAALRWGWDALIGIKGGFVGMDSFGASAPAEALYAHFGITAEAVAEEALKRV
jgi:transketolase